MIGVRTHTYVRLRRVKPVVSPVDPNESLYSSLRDRWVRSKRAAKAVSRGLEVVEYPLALVLWERRLIPEFIAR